MLRAALDSIVRRSGGLRRAGMLTVLLGACTPAIGTEIVEPASPTPEPVAIEEPGPKPVMAVAFVNDVPITTTDFRAIYDLKLQKYADRGREIPKTADRRYKKSLTERLIWQEVLRQEAKKRGLSHDPAALAARMEQQTRSIEGWDKHLRRRGESNESLRQLYIAELLERAILDQEGQLEISEAELRAEYETVRSNYYQDEERVRAAHILVHVGPDPAPDQPTAAQQQQWEAEARTKIEAIHAEASAPGADFAQLAIERSEGPSARKGGDLGLFTADRMVEEFSKAAFALKPGELSTPVQTKFGFHIIKVYGKYPPGELPFEALEDQIRERLAARRLHEGRRELRAELLEAYAIDNLMADTLGPDPREQVIRDEEPRSSGAQPAPPLPPVPGA